MSYYIVIGDHPWCEWLGSVAGAEIAKETGIDQCSYPDKVAAQCAVDNLSLRLSRVRMVEGVCPALKEEPGAILVGGRSPMDWARDAGPYARTALAHGWTFDGIAWKYPGNTVSHPTAREVCEWFDYEVEPDTSDIPEVGPAFFAAAKLTTPESRALRAALQLTTDRLEEAFDTHIYDRENGDEPDANCEYTLAIKVGRDALAGIVAPAPDRSDLLVRLLEWADHMGGWEAPIWDEVKASTRAPAPSDPAIPALDARELATVLAALRFWQSRETVFASHVSEPLEEIATDGGTLLPLTVEEIDDLYERLNA